MIHAPVEAPGGARKSFGYFRDYSEIRRNFWLWPDDTQPTMMMFGGRSDKELVRETCLKLLYICLCLLFTGEEVKLGKQDQSLVGKMRKYIKLHFVFSFLYPI